MSGPWAIADGAEDARRTKKLSHSAECSTTRHEGAKHRRRDICGHAELSGCRWSPGCVNSRHCREKAPRGIIWSNSSLHFSTKDLVPAKDSLFSLVKGCMVEILPLRSKAYNVDQIIA